MSKSGAAGADKSAVRTCFWLAGLAASSWATADAGILERLHLAAPPDPKIESLTVFAAPELNLAGAEILIFPIEAPQGGSPRPPRFDLAVEQAFAVIEPNLTVDRAQPDSRSGDPSATPTGW